MRWWLLCLAACGRSGGIDFPDQLTPLEPVNQAPPVAPVSGDAHPEVLSVVSGSGLVDEDGEEVYWAHARGFVKADLEHTWLAAQDIDVCVDRREVAEWTVTWDTVPEFDVSYTIHNVVRNVLTVRYDMTWVHERQSGERVVIRWDLTDSPGVISILRGSAVLHPVADGVTEIELIAHLQATLRDEATLESYLRDTYADLLAVVHGRPLQPF